jgi:hypothetical protein
MYTLYKRKVCFSCDVMLSPFSTDRRTKRHSGWYLRCICLSPNEFKYKEVAVVNFTGKIINNSFESPWNAQKMREMKSVRVRDFARVSRVLDVLFLFSVYLGNILIHSETDKYISDTSHYVFSCACLWKKGSASHHNWNTLSFCKACTYTCTLVYVIIKCYF